MSASLHRSMSLPPRGGSTNPINACLQRVAGSGLSYYTLASEQYDLFRHGRRVITTVFEDLAEEMDRRDPDVGFLHVYGVRALRLFFMIYTDFIETVLWEYREDIENPSINNNMEGFLSMSNIVVRYVREFSSQRKDKDKEESCGLFSIPPCETWVEKDSVFTPIIKRMATDWERESLIKDFHGSVLYLKTPYGFAIRFLGNERGKLAELPYYISGDRMEVLPLEPKHVYLHSKPFPEGIRRLTCVFSPEGSPEKLGECVIVRLTPDSLGTIIKEEVFGLTNGIPLPVEFSCEAGFYSGKFRTEQGSAVATLGEILIGGDFDGIRKKSMRRFRDAAIYASYRSPLEMLKPDSAARAHLEHLADIQQESGKTFVIHIPHTNQHMIEFTAALIEDLDSDLLSEDPAIVKKAEALRTLLLEDINASAALASLASMSEESLFEDNVSTMGRASVEGESQDAASAKVEDRPKKKKGKKPTKKQKKAAKQAAKAAARRAAAAKKSGAGAGGAGAGAGNPCAREAEAFDALKGKKRWKPIINVLKRFGIQQLRTKGSHATFALKDAETGAVVASSSLVKPHTEKGVHLLLKRAKGLVTSLFSKVRSGGFLEKR